nr:Bcr/CflA family efflux MFS transporter [Fangia hongkongensis]
MSVNRYFIAFFVNFTIPLGGMSTDIYLPSLPAMAKYFNTSSTEVQLTVTLFALGLAIGQVLTGPISDALGRKKIYLLGIILQLASVLYILLSTTVLSLIIVRFIQGFGAALMMVPARAMLNDVFEGAALKKQYTYITAAFALGPIIAPFIGGYLQHYFNWHASFIFVLIYLVVLFIICLLFVPETINSKKNFSLSHLTHSYHTVLTNKKFVTGALLLSFFFGYVATFNVAGPFIIQNLMGKNAIFYGYIALLMGVAWFAGNMISRLFFRFKLKHKSYALLGLILLMSVIMFVINLSSLSVPRFITPVFIITMSAGFLFPIYVGECLSLFRQEAASANGLLFAIIWVSFSLFSFIAANLKVHSLMPLLSCYVIVSLILLLVYIMIVARHHS